VPNLRNKLRHGARWFRLFFFRQALLFTAGETIVEQGFDAGIQRREVIQQGLLTVVNLVDQTSLVFGRAHAQWFAGAAWASGIPFGETSLSASLCCTWHRLFPLEALHRFTNIRLYGLDKLDASINRAGLGN